MCISRNEKTFRSIDFLRNCKRGCPYCYVSNARKRGYNASNNDHRKYNGEILRLSDATVKTLNRIGGLRFFSFGDYTVDDDNNIHRALRDAETIGLDVKAITKRPDFIKRFAKYDALKIINVSIDNIGYGVPLQQARQLRHRYTKVKIRSVVLQDSDLEVLTGVSDVITFNHSDNGYINYSRDKKHRAYLIRKYKIKDKVCCLSSYCITCKLKCGIN